MSEHYENIVLEGKAFYLNANKPNELSGKYQMDLAIDSGTVNKLRTIGISIKNKGDERGDFVTPTRNLTTKTGEPMRKPQVIDIDRNPLPEDLVVGNGSDVKVIVKPYDWKFKGKSGTSLGLDVVQVLNLIPYTSKKLDLLG